jgi:hypothetical protein
MKKSLMVLLLIAALGIGMICIGPVSAQSEKEDFQATWCRTSVNAGVTIDPGESGRSIRKDGFADWTVTSNDPRVQGQFYAYDVTFNLSKEVPGIGNEGLVHAEFILTPDVGSGTWEGQWRCLYTIEDGVRYATVTANGHGTGDFDGMKIRVYGKRAYVSPTCKTEKPENVWPWDGYILFPASVE